MTLRIKNPNGGEGHNLPSGYVELEYIHGEGPRGGLYATAIDSDYKPNNNTKIEIDIMFTNNATGMKNQIVFFGTTNSFTTDAFGLYFGSDDNAKLWSSYGTDDMDLSDYFTGALNTKYNIVSDKNQVYIDGNLIYTHTASTFQSTGYLIIGGSNWNYGKWLKGNIYSCKIWDNGTLIRNYIPCRRTSDSKVGMYDLVRNRFSSSAGDTEYTAGPEISPYLEPSHWYIKDPDNPSAYKELTTIRIKDPDNPGSYKTVFGGA